MHLSNCKCAHHKIHKLVGVLALVSAIGFWVASAWKTRIYGISAIHFFKEFIVFALIGMGMHRGCTCCCGGCADCSIAGK